MRETLPQKENKVQRNQQKTHFEYLRISVFICLFLPSKQPRLTSNSHGLIGKIIGLFQDLNPGPLRP